MKLIRAIQVVRQGQIVDFRTFRRSMAQVWAAEPGDARPKWDDFHSIVLASPWRIDLLPQLAWLKDQRRFRSFGCVGDRLVFDNLCTELFQVKILTCVGPDRWDDTSQIINRDLVFNDRCFGAMLQV